MAYQDCKVEGTVQRVFEGQGKAPALVTIGIREPRLRPSFPQFKVWKNSPAFSVLTEAAGEDETEVMVTFYLQTGSREVAGKTVYFEDKVVVDAVKVTAKSQRANAGQALVAAAAGEPVVLGEIASAALRKAQEEAAQTPGSPQNPNG